MYIFDTVNMNGLKSLIDEKRNAAKAEAQELYPCAFSRGTFISTIDKHGEQCKPQPEAECFNWEGTRNEIDILIAFVESEYPDAHEIRISGGYDGAESPHAYYRNDDYEPWVSSWYETVWTRS